MAVQTTITNANLVEGTDANFAAEVLGSDIPVLVDFWAEWCEPCKMIAPIVSEIATEYAGKLRVAKLDIDVNQQTAIQFQVMAIPTMIVFKDGQPVKRIVGFKPKQMLISELQSAGII